jgi:hypothetical protein
MGVNQPVDDPTVEHIIQTASGLYYDYLKPEPDMIRLSDIAHQLAGTCRFSAACDPWYSVAEHSVLVSRLVPEPFKLDALFHDSPEAYLWDVPKPAKALYGRTYVELTDLCEIAIGEAFGLDLAKLHSREVQEADTTMLNYEGNELLPHWSADKPTLPPGILDWRIGLLPRQAKQLFLTEAAKLGRPIKVDVAPPLPPLEDVPAWKRRLGTGHEQLAFIPTTKGTGSCETM